VPYVYRPQELKVYLYSVRVEHAIKKMVRTD